MSVSLQTIKETRSYIAKELEKIYNEQEISALSNIIIKTAIGISRLHQLYSTDNIVTGEQFAKIIEVCRELKSGKPIQYILGETIFYDCKIRVTSAALIPRPETEELVDLIIRENRSYKGTIIDFGTGSGCIAIALAANLRESLITGIEISDDAICLARENSQINNVNISFIKGDILRFNNHLVNEAGIIVSNPPYIRNSEKQLMSNNVLDFEPHMALFVEDRKSVV